MGMGEEQDTETYLKKAVKDGGGWRAGYWNLPREGYNDGDGVKKWWGWRAGNWNLPEEGSKRWWLGEEQDTETFLGEGMTHMTYMDEGMCRCMLKGMIP